jgi:glucoamylase
MTALVRSCHRSTSSAITGSPFLETIARTANDGLMLPEQVWDDAVPPGEQEGEGTRSATPLAWTHAWFVRLAWSIDAGDPIERPAIVACRYQRELCGRQVGG